jgi:hypothetical protein
VHRALVPRALAIALVLASCKPRHAHDDAAPPPPRDAAPRDAEAWPELASIAHVDPVRVVALPVQTNTPRFDVGGPVIAGDVAVVASSQFAFIAVDYRRGQLSWTKPAGLHVAPPLARGGDVVLIGDCINPPEIAASERLLGCLRAVSPTGGDQAYVAIHGRARDVEGFALGAGAQAVSASGDHTITWRRGEHAVAVDTLSGVATVATAEDPPLVVHYKDRTWQIARAEDGRIVAREHGKLAWTTQHPYTTLLGAVYLPGQSPMVRVSNAGAFGGHAELNLLDIDATGSLHGQVAFPVPGITLLGHAIDAVGDTALAVRLDASLERDFIAGYAANALLMWAYPLPRQPRPDPVGVAIAPDAVVVFHDGDTLTILPELSAPATAPGATRVPSENTTP